MTKEECVALLYRYAEYNGIGIPNLAGCREAMKMAADMLSQPSLPDNLDEVAAEYGVDNAFYWTEDDDSEIQNDAGKLRDAFKAGAEWMAGQGWIDDGSMPPEHKDVCTGHMVSDRVLAWDSMYDARVDFTINGKWASETRGGYTGQVCHGIVAWRPIPEYKEKQ